MTNFGLCFPKNSLKKKNTQALNNTSPSSSLTAFLLHTPLNSVYVRHCQTACDKPVLKSIPVIAAGLSVSESTQHLLNLNVSLQVTSWLRSHYRITHRGGTFLGIKSCSEYLFHLNLWTPQKWISTDNVKIRRVAKKPSQLDSCSLAAQSNMKSGYRNQPCVK